MGYKNPGKRDGTGPARGSFRRSSTGEGKTIGRRGAVCKTAPKKK